VRHPIRTTNNEESANRIAGNNSDTVPVYFSRVLHDSNISQSLVLMEGFNNNFYVVTTKLCIQWVPGVPSRGERRTRNEAHYSPTSSTEVKNEWS
jgi:hypothetical protein